MVIPSEIYVVVDDHGQPVFSATWPAACHEHLNDAISEYGVDEAATWVVRRYVLAPADAKPNGPSDPHVKARFERPL